MSFINEENIIKSKYFKYKLKYTKTKNQNGGSIIVQLKTITGKIIDIECESLNITIIELKHLIFFKETITEYSQDIIYNGKRLQNESILYDVNPNNKQMYLRLGNNGFTPSFDKLPDPYFLINQENYDYYSLLYKNCIRLYYEHLILEIKFKRLLKNNFGLTIDDINSINPELVNLCILGREMIKFENLKNNMIEKSIIFLRQTSEMTSENMKLYISKDNHFVLKKSKDIDPSMKLLFIYSNGKIKKYILQYELLESKSELLESKSIVLKPSIATLFTEIKPTLLAEIYKSQSIIIQLLNKESIKNITKLKEIEEINKPDNIECLNLKLEEQKQIINKMIHDDSSFQLLDVHIRGIVKLRVKERNPLTSIYKLLEHGIYFYITFIKRISEYLPNSENLIKLLKIFALLNYTEA